MPFVTYPSLGHGEPLYDEIASFSIGHGLFSLLDAFPYQHPEARELSVSIPVGPGPAGSARLFGQGARAPLRVRGLEQVALHADLTNLAKLACALARVVPLAA